MTCEHLVCASCSGPVAEGRCASCRAQRAGLHSHEPHVSAQVIMAVAAILAVLAALAVYGHI